MGCPPNTTLHYQESRSAAAVVNVTPRVRRADLVNVSSSSMAHHLFGLPPGANIEACSPVFLQPSAMDLLINCQIGPSVILFTVITNVLISIVLTKPHMVSPTNIILLSMALADLFTGLFPFTVYVAKNWESFNFPVTTTKAYLDFILTNIVPTVFHTASTWLTVILAVQRFIYVTFPVRVGEICTTRNSVIASVVVYVLATFFHMILFNFQFIRFRVTCLPKSVDNLPPTRLNYSSLATFESLLKCDLNSNTILTLYHSTRVLLINVIPCLLLIVFTVLLIVALSRAAAKRRRLLANSNNNNGTSARDHRQQDSTSTSRMLVVVLTIFLIVELPTGVLISMYMIFRFVGARHLFRILPWVEITRYFNFGILVSYPVNFFVYCGMSRQFRNTFRALFRCCGGTTARERRNNGGGAETNSQLSKMHRLDDISPLDNEKLRLVLLNTAATTHRRQAAAKSDQDADEIETEMLLESKTLPPNI